MPTRLFNDTIADIQADLILEDIMQEWSIIPGVNQINDQISGWVQDQLFDAFVYVFGDILFKISAGIGTVVGIKIIGKLLKRLVKASKDKVDKHNAGLIQVEDLSFEREVIKLEEQGQTLTTVEIFELKERIAQELAEKYPRKQLAWWQEFLDKLGDLLGSSFASLLAVFSIFILL